MVQQRRFTQAGLLLILMTALTSGWAATPDTLERVLERIHITATRHFSYRETRYLQLLATPWQATGDLYTSLQQMVIAQQAPTRVLTIIVADSMRYIEPEQGIDRNLKLNQPFAVPGMEPFMLLLYGANGQVELQQDYLIRFTNTGQRWTLQLTPRSRSPQAIVRLLLSGDRGQGPDRLALEHDDGDRTEWQLSLLSQGATASRELRQLIENIQ